MRDYYAILEVAPTATLSDIKRSYRRLARRHHPDLNSQALDTHIKLLNEAYEVLSDLQKRAIYDLLRRAAEERRTVDQDALRRQQSQVKSEPKMTWPEGVKGFFQELKKGLQKE